MFKSSFLSLLISFNVFAVDICSFEQTWEFSQAVEDRGQGPVRVSRDHTKFTSVELKLILKTLEQEYGKGKISLARSVELFSDLHEGMPGYNAGEVVYYNFEGKQIILIHYWPGDNEYGAIFTINRNGSFKLLAKITDSFIECK
jgi:hypothetical protein